jgi:hypothetical protein
LLGIYKFLHYLSWFAGLEVEHGFAIVFLTTSFQQLFGMLLAVSLTNFNINFSVLSAQLNKVVPIVMNSANKTFCDTEFVYKVHD